MVAKIAINQHKLQQQLIKILVALSLLMTLSQPVSAKAAGGLANLMKYSQSNGTMTNVNRGAVVSDQKAGYVIGGSIISRGPKPEVLRPLVVQPPSFEFDPCTGSYDARFGGLSYIARKEFAGFLKKIPEASGAYGLKLLIKQVCPQCENITTYLETVARDINNFSLNQCNLAKSLAKGSLSILDSSSKQLCMMKSNIRRDNKDIFGTTEKCNDNPDFYKGEDEALKSLLGDNFNLVWKALNQGENAGKSELKELMMSISGSVIGTKKEGMMRLSVLPSLVEKEDLIEKYIGMPGKQASEIVVYKCNDYSKCLHPLEQSKTLGGEETLYGKVTSLLEQIVDKIYKNEGTLSSDEQALIEFSSIPLISLIELEIASKNLNSAESLVGMHEFVEVVCYDLITSYMQKMLVEARSAVDQLATVQLDNTAIDKFMQNINMVRGYLKDKRYESLHKLQVITQVKERIIQQQSVFELGFGRFMDNWGKSK